MRFYSRIYSIYGKKDTIKIGWEHNHFHNNYKYAHRVINSSKKLDYLVLVSSDLLKYYKKQLVELHETQKKKDEHESDNKNEEYSSNISETSENGGYSSSKSNEEKEKEEEKKIKEIEGFSIAKITISNLITAFLTDVNIDKNFLVDKIIFYEMKIL